MVTALGFCPAGAGNVEAGTDLTGPTDAALGFRSLRDKVTRPSLADVEGILTKRAKKRVLLNVKFGSVTEEG